MLPGPSPRQSESDNGGERLRWLRRCCMLLFAAGILGFSAGCVNTLPTRDAPSPADDGIATPPPTDTPAAPLVDVEPAPPPPSTDLWVRLRNGFALADVQNPAVDAEVARLIRNTAAFTALLEQSRPFLHYVLDQVEQRDLPAELALLPAVESGYRPTAMSPNGAVGIWQFMPATGRRFKLVQDWWYDGRRDPIASTRAALDYLEHLLARFDGDWLLALAAYNAGGGTVSRAVRRNRTQGLPTDFWSLDLPGETDSYVPRLLALARIIADPQTLGITLPELDNAPQFAVVDAGAQIDLRVAARLAAVPEEDLFRLNAGYSRAATRPHGPHRLLVPVGAADRLAAALQDLPDDERLLWERYQVRRGDTLGAIAHRYGIQVTALKQANRLKSDLIHPGHNLLIPLSDVASTLIAQRPAVRTRLHYRVRRGDSLYAIAHRFDVSISELKRWNRLPGRLIKPGQVLVVYQETARSNI